LLDVAAVNGAVTPYHVGFRLGPRLNAAGRVGDAMAALELLLTEDAARAAELAKLLNERNTERQQIEERIVAEASAQAREHAGDRVLVLAGENWHVGVIGIVASRVAQEFYRPTVVIGADGKGSCRSITGFSIVAALRECAAALDRFGGHEMAAGVSVKPGCVEELRRGLNEYAGAKLDPEDLRPRVRIDAELTLAEVTADFLEQLDRFEPCGQDNPTPVFAVRRVSVRGTPRVVGRNHLKFQVTDGATTLPAIWWGMGDRQLPPGPFALAFQPEWNEFNGVTTVQLKVRDVAGE
jgi:single-stranded-DNA-specific exonuclease